MRKSRGRDARCPYTWSPASEDVCPAPIADIAIAKNTCSMSKNEMMLVVQLHTIAWRTSFAALRKPQDTHHVSVKQRELVRTRRRSCALRHRSTGRTPRRLRIEKSQTRQHQPSAPCTIHAAEHSADIVTRYNVRSINSRLAPRHWCRRQREQCPSWCKGSSEFESLTGLQS